jgi:hypothetical protein
MAGLKMREPMHSVDFYVLGVLRFNRESEGESVVLSDSQLEQVIKFLDEEFGSYREYRDPWYVWNLKKGGVVEEIKNILREKLGKVHEQRGKGFDGNIWCRLGYYHHRVIFHIHFRLHTEKEKVLTIIRDVRDKLHYSVRTHLKKALLGKALSGNVSESEAESSKLQISYIYTYPFIVIYDGVKLVKKPKDRVFSAPTTAFFFEIPEGKWRGLWFRSHYARISIFSTMLYASKKVGDSLFWGLVNSIYYAALYPKKLQDLKSAPKRAQSGEKLDELDEEILLNLSSHILLRNVVELEIQKIHGGIAWLALLVALVSILISIFKEQFLAIVSSLCKGLP